MLLTYRLHLLDFHMNKINFFEYMISLRYMYMLPTIIMTVFSSCIFLSTCTFFLSSFCLFLLLLRFSKKNCACTLFTLSKYLISIHLRRKRNETANPLFLHYYKKQPRNRKIIVMLMLRSVIFMPALHSTNMEFRFSYELILKRVVSGNE